MIDNLLALPFSTQNHHYIYDAVTNRIFYAPEPTFLILKRYQHQPRDVIEAKLVPQYGTAAVQAGYNRVSRWVEEEDAFFVKHPLVFPKLTEDNYWEMLLKEQGVRQLFLIITDNCNLRCKYCVYSGQYEGYRQHNTAVMSLETAKAAIKYYHQIHQNIYIPDKPMFINFYGGEPLLRFNFIKRCVAYALSLDDCFAFGLTTNGTLMKESHVGFFIKHKFNLVFSLDGPKEEHDRNRVFPNDRGTYDKVMKSIKRVRSRDPDYFREHVMLSSVYDKNTDLVTTNDFFIKHKEQLPRGGFVTSQRHRSVQEDEATDNAYQVVQKTQLLRRFLLAKMGGEAHDTVFLDRLWMSFRLIANRNYERLEQLRYYTGRCLPGAKIAVRPDGTLHMCERINEHFPIGHVDKGLDFERIHQVMTLYDHQVTKNCASCVAVRFCQVCYAQACTEDGFDTSQMCDVTLDQLKIHLTYLCVVLEENPNAFDEMKERPRVVELMTAC